jgi:hypothetical protein
MQRQIPGITQEEVKCHSISIVHGKTEQHRKQGEFQQPEQGS